MASTETETGIRWPRWLNTSSKRLWVIGPVVTAVLYVGVLVIYGLSTQTPEVAQLASTDKLTVYFNPRSVKPAEDLVAVSVMLSPPSSLVTDAGALAQDVEVELPQNGKVLKFAKGDRVLTKDIELTVERSTYEKYPIDSYQTPIVVTASTTVGKTVTPLPTEAVVWGKFPGWHVLSTSSQSPLPKVDADNLVIAAELQDPNTSAVALTVRRAGSTLGIVVLLLGAACDLDPALADPGAGAVYAAAGPALAAPGTGAASGAAVYRRDGDGLVLGARLSAERPRSQALGAVRSASACAAAVDAARPARPARGDPHWPDRQPGDGDHGQWQPRWQ